MANIFGTGADGSLTVSGTTTVTMRQIYENDSVTGITTNRGAGKGLNKGSGTYMASADAMPNFVNVTIDSGQKIIGDTSNRYADAGHTFFKCSGTLSGAGSIDESGCGGAGGTFGSTASASASGGGQTGGATGSIYNAVNNGTLRGGGSGGGAWVGTDGTGMGVINGGAGGTGNSTGGGGGGGGWGINADRARNDRGGNGGNAGYATGYNANSGQAGSASSNAVNTYSHCIGGKGGDGGIYGSANFGDNDYKLCDEFYIGSGGGGGGCAGHGGADGGTGGDGGGKIKIFAKGIADTVGIYANGVNGTSGGSVSGYIGGNGGNGSGGSIWILSNNAAIGAGKVTASGGTGAGAGRIRIDGIYTGTTSPTVGYYNETRFKTSTASNLLLMLN